MNRKVTVGFIGAALVAVAVLLLMGWRLHFRDLDLTLKITGIQFPEQGQLVEQAFWAVPGVYHVEVNVGTGVAKCYMRVAEGNRWPLEAKKLTQAVTAPFRAHVQRSSYSFLRLRK